MGQEPRQTTSNIGQLQKASIQALVHGLNRHYYSIAIDYRKNELEQIMLMNLHKKVRPLLMLGPRYIIFLNLMLYRNGTKAFQ
jgi:hypothetical protein